MGALRTGTVALAPLARSVTRNAACAAKATASVQVAMRGPSETSRVRQRSEAGSDSSQEAAFMESETSAENAPHITPAAGHRSASPPVEPAPSYAPGGYALKRLFLQE